LGFVNALKSETRENGSMGKTRELGAPQQICCRAVQVVSENIRQRPIPGMKAPARCLFLELSAIKILFNI
jgi:hypothetical protein